LLPPLSFTNPHKTKVHTFYWTCVHKRHLKTFIVIKKLKRIQQVEKTENCMVAKNMTLLQVVYKTGERRKSWCYRILRVRGLSMTTQQTSTRICSVRSGSMDCFKQNILVKDLQAGEETHHSRLQCSLELEAVAFFLKLLVLLVFVFFVTKGTIMITFFK
jgi:hypothetical protein